jgi:hypothetical protein
VPREKAIYEDVEEFDGMLAKLVELNSEQFVHIDNKVIKMVMITNKEPTGTPYKLKVVRQPVGRFCKDVRFIVVVFQQDWESYSEDQKALVILNVLLSMEPDEDEPKVKPFDMTDHATMFRTFGVDYLNNPEIRGLFNKPVDWNP